MKKRDVQLKKFKNEELEKKKKIYTSLAVALFFLIAGIIVYRTFAIFEKNIEQSVVNVDSSNPNAFDVQVMMAVGNTFVDMSLEELIDQGFGVADEHCTNGAIISVDLGVKKIKISNLTKTKTICYIDWK